MIVLLQLLSNNLELNTLQPYKLKRCFPLSSVALRKKIHNNFTTISQQNVTKKLNIKKCKI